MAAPAEVVDAMGGVASRRRSAIVTAGERS
jgi:hypothetical protein